MAEFEKVDYLEFPTTNIEASKAFFNTVFNWSFTDYGPEYTAFDNAGIEGGFFTAEKTSLTANGAGLVIFLSDSLDETLAKVVKGGGTIAQDIFEFPGGKRFHFIEPGGNEFAVWTKIENQP